MNTFKKLLPSLLALGSVALTAFTPSIQSALGGFVTSHPTVAASITAAFGIFAHLWPSPVASSK